MLAVFFSALLSTTEPSSQPEPDPGLDTTGAFGRGSSVTVSTDFSLVDACACSSFSSFEAGVAGTGVSFSAATSFEDGLDRTESFAACSEMSLLRRTHSRAESNKGRKCEARQCQAGPPLTCQTPRIAPMDAGGVDTEHTRRPRTLQWLSPSSFTPRPQFTTAGDNTNENLGEIL